MRPKTAAAITAAVMHPSMFSNLLFTRSLITFGLFEIMIISTSSAIQHSIYHAGTAQPHRSKYATNSRRFSSDRAG
jgi:hypothetical protein